MATEDTIREAVRALARDGMDRASRSRLAAAWLRAGRPVEVIGRDPREDPRPLDLVGGKTRRLVVAIARRRGEVAWVGPGGASVRWLPTADPCTTPLPAQASAPIPWPVKGRLHWTSIAAWRRWARARIDMHGAARVLWVEPYDWGEWHLSVGGSQLPEGVRQRAEQDRARREADFFDWGSP